MSKNDLERRVAALEAENLALSEKVAALASPKARSAPKAEQPEVSITIAQPRVAGLPSDLDLAQLYQLVSERHPKLKRPTFSGRWQAEEVEEDTKGFKLCFAWARSLGRSPTLVTMYGPDFWIARCEEFGQAVGLSGKVSRRLIACAAIAQGDVNFNIDRLPHALILSLHPLGGHGKSAAPDAWRSVLAGVILPPTRLPDQPAWNCGVAGEIRVAG